jgi:hypothetical protein
MQSNPATRKTRLYAPPPSIIFAPLALKHPAPPQRKPQNLTRQRPADAVELLGEEGHHVGAARGRHQALHQLKVYAAGVVLRHLGRLLREVVAVLGF